MSANRPVPTLAVSGITLIVDLAGALYWSDQRLLIVADLHLEKGSSFAKRGILLPPYDTAATLHKMGLLIARYAPSAVIALGDSFHDGGGPTRIAPRDRATLARLQRGRDWIWIAGNHDPEPCEKVGGDFARALALGPLVFRHVPSGEEGEVAGHLHPSARVIWRGHTVVRRCFVANASRLIMPAFGAYTGGRDIRERVFADLFDRFTAHVLGDRRLYTFSGCPAP